MRNQANKDNPFKIFEADPLLKPFEQDIQLRMESYLSIKKRLLGKMRKLKSFANGHLFFGFHASKDGWYYREWAPGAEALYLRGDFNNWNSESHPLKKNGNGVWEIFLPGVKTLEHLSHVMVIVKANGVTRERVPLYIRRAVQDISTHAFKGQIWHPERSYKWSDSGFSVNSTKPLFIYEAHVGMAQEREGIGTFREFTENILPRIKKSGYNAVQLMGIMDHPYYASFGYHVSNFFAVSSWFGTPDDLKELINTAHSMGLIVLMDLVHSHAIKNIDEGINEFDGTAYQFFHEGQRGTHQIWDSKLFNYGKPEVIHFLLSNIKFWMEEYHFDGFRFDGVTSMIYHNHGIGVSFDNYKMYFSSNTDIEAINYLQFANEMIKEIRNDAISIAEDMSGMPGMCLPIQDGGLGFDYRLTMGVPDFWINTLKDVDENWNIGKLWYELSTRRPLEKNIGYAESHDQAMVGDKTIFFRLADKEIYWHMSKEDNSLAVNRAIALHKLIRFVTISLSGEGYLNFMGNEFGHPEWIDFPREGNNWSHKYARRQWSLVDNSDLQYEYLYKFDKEMLDFVTTYCISNDINPKSLFIHEKDKLLAFKRKELVFLFNFHPTESFPNFNLPTGEKGSYKVIFNSDESRFGGYDRIPQDIIYCSKPLVELENTIGLTIYTPSRTALVLKKIDS
jgi:1,4-alpha-glucan branching enzyme